jgi:CRISPR-associated protein Cas6
VSTMLDVAFAISGETIDAAYAVSLYEALARQLQWLEQEPAAGVFSIRGLTHSADALLIGGRTRVVLRVPAGRVADCQRLRGQCIDLPQPLRIGAVTARELLPFPVLYARLVITGSEAEADFLAEVQAELKAVDVDSEVIVGRRGALQIGGRSEVGYSVMLHGLTPEESILMQERGLGRHRKLGCGLFVPHKSVAAVGG